MWPSVVWSGLDSRLSLGVRADIGSFKSTCITITTIMPLLTQYEDSHLILSHISLVHLSLFFLFLDLAMKSSAKFTASL